MYATLLRTCFVSIVAGTALFGCNEASNRIDPEVAANIGAGCTTADDCGNVFSCLEDFPGGFCAFDCGSSSDCPDGSLCRSVDGGGVCVPSCDDDLDCRNGYRCSQVLGSDGQTYGVCEPGSGGGGTIDAGGDGGSDAGLPDTGEDTVVPDVPPGAPNWGSACASAATCSAGDLDPRCLTEGQGFPGGYCSASCDAGSGDCGETGGCINTSAGGLCMATCSATDDCRDGYRCCAQDNGEGLCLPDALAGRCEEPGTDPDPEPGEGNTEPPAAGEVGAGCGGSEECDEGDAPYCFDQIPGGLCTSQCETREDCGEGNWCLQGGGGIPNFCVRGCAADSGCNDGQVCCDYGTAAVCVVPQLCR